MESEELEVDPAAPNPLPASTPLPSNETTNEEWHELSTFETTSIAPDDSDDSDEYFSSDETISESRVEHDSPTEAPKSLSGWERLKQGFKKSKKKKISISVLILTILAFIINAALLQPAFKGEQAADKSIDLAAWEAAKDFQEICKAILMAINQSTPECRQALDMVLPPPPLFESIALNHVVTRLPTKTRRAMESSLNTSRIFSLRLRSSGYALDILTVLLLYLVGSGGVIWLVYSFQRPRREGPLAELPHLPISSVSATSLSNCDPAIYSRALKKTDLDLSLRDTKPTYSRMLEMNLSSLLGFENGYTSSGSANSQVHALRSQFSSGLCLFRTPHRLRNVIVVLGIDVALVPKGIMFRVEFWFPRWLIPKLITLEGGWSGINGPRLTIRSFHVVPDDGKAAVFAPWGNIVGLKTLLKEHLAGPNDVSDSCGHSLLQLAIDSRQPEMIEFLLNVGADVEYRSVVFRTWTPSTMLLTFGLETRNFMTNSDVSIPKLPWLRTICHGLGLPISTRTVLKLEIGDLSRDLLRQKYEINSRDLLGRTTLSWAAAVGDSDALVFLLANGASAHIVDEQGDTPLSLAASHDRSSCLRLLLENGVNTSHVSENGGNALHVAAKYPSHPLIVKYLLDYGAKVDELNVHGRTPLEEAARSSNASFDSSVLLLEYNANISRRESSIASLPLVTAITYNNHSMLWLLLQFHIERYSKEFSEDCVFNLELLARVLEFADEKTFSILTESGRRRGIFKHAKSLHRLDVNRFTERVDITAELMGACEVFLDEVQSESLNIQNSDTRRLVFGG